MISLLWVSCILSVLAYEKIDIYSDNLSLLNITRDDIEDKVIVESETRIGISYKTTTFTTIPLPKGLQEFYFSITNPEQNTGRYTLETPFEGVHISLQYERKQAIENVCDLFETILPCFNVKQCNWKRILIHLHNM